MLIIDKAQHLIIDVHESLKDRLVVRYHRPGLGRDEFEAYLTHRLRLVGAEAPIFAPPAIEALFQASRGLPRTVNRIAHYALAAAALDNQHQVNETHLRTALDEITRSPENHYAVRRPGIN